MSKWIVPGYTELKELGSGGFGSVVLATHDATGTAVAIKYLNPGHQGPDDIALFRTEAESLGTLNDPNVVRLYEYVESPAGAAIVMELVDGVTLWDILHQHGKTTPEAALVVLYGSLLGLAAAHERGVVHRDYKPRNVLINANGASKLTDFGIAARSGALTLPAGTVAYAPPEQFAGSPATPASDVYAATATFYECLTGRPPFTGETSYSVIEQHRTAEVPMDQVPEPLQPIIARGMAKDPQYRPSDAAELARGLRAAAVSAYGPDWEQRGRSNLGEAAFLLALLWPTVGVPALQSAVGQVQAEQIHVSQAAQHAPAADHTQATQAHLHQSHLRHVRHLKHLNHLRNAAATVTAAAVVAAVVTVAYTSRPPSGPGTPSHPAVAAYQAPLAPPASISLTPSVAFPSVNGNAYVLYDPAGTAGTEGGFSGEIEGATMGEVARLYAQPFPYTSPPVSVGSVTLNPVGGTAKYVFGVSPVVATRYQVKLLPSATATTPIATSASRTIYVTDAYSLLFENKLNPFHPTCVIDNTQTLLQTCTVTRVITIYSPPSVIQEQMSKHIYPYFSYTPAGKIYPPSLQLDPSATVATPKRVADNAYQVTVTYRENSNAVGNFDICTKPTEAQDGIGLPGPSACGSSDVSGYAYYLWGGVV